MTDKHATRDGVGGYTCYCTRSASYYVTCTHYNDASAITFAAAWCVDTRETSKTDSLDSSFFGLCCNVT